MLKYFSVHLTIIFLFSALYYTCITLNWNGINMNDNTKQTDLWFCPRHTWEAAKCFRSENVMNVIIESDCWKLRNIVLECKDLFHTKLSACYWSIHLIQHINGCTYGIWNNVGVISTVICNILFLSSSLFRNPCIISWAFPLRVTGQCFLHFGKHVLTLRDLCQSKIIIEI